MRKEMGLFRFLALVVVMVSMPVQVGGEDLPETSVRDLIQRLAVEEEVSETGRLESDVRNGYDVVVEELLIRADPDSVPALIERVNDGTPVKGVRAIPAILCGYDSPVRVKDKVRFILRRMLSPEDFSEMFGDGMKDQLDAVKAMAYFNSNRERITQSLSKLSVPTVDRS